MNSSDTSPKEPSFSHLVLQWFDKHGRKNLPWQQNPSRYSVWVSEIMLQQTQVATVIPYYQRFMTRFPNVTSLANADIDEVLHLWTGLGYYARARNLHKAAIQIVEQHASIFPYQLDDVIALPGIGKSTAAAILSLADDQAHVILDGNVKRVLARYFAVEGWPGNKRIEDQLWEYARQLKPPARFNHYTQAMMDLGATLCTRNKPNCEECPVNQRCLAFIQGRQSELPHRKPKKDKPTKQTNMHIVFYQGSVLLYKRPSEGIWGGLWSFYEDEGVMENFLNQVNLEQVEEHILDGFTHTFSHFHLDITPRVLICQKSFSAESGNRVEEASPVNLDIEPSNSKQTQEIEQNKPSWFNIYESIEVGLAAPTVKIIKQLKSLF